MVLIDWSLTEPEIIDWDDGHIPENLRRRSHPSPSGLPGRGDEDASSPRTTKLVVQPRWVRQRRPRIRVRDEAVPREVVEAIYHITVHSPQPSWGTYVTLDQIRQYQAKQGLSNEHCSMGEATHLSTSSPTVSPDENCNNIASLPIIPAPEQMASMSQESRQEWQDALALRAATVFLESALLKDDACSFQWCGALIEDPFFDGDKSGPDPTRPQMPLSSSADVFWTLDDMTLHAHGVAVWALASEQGAQVPYHIDYAEQIRYRTNIIVPPVLAGTLQCTAGEMVGGDYCAHLDGLDHYRRHGYKGLLTNRKESVSTADQVNDHGSGDGAYDSLLEEMKTDPRWIRIPYQYNRLICQSGHLPHLSTLVERLPVKDPTSIPRKRVIMGFNVFLSDVGPWVQQAPEHSEAFRRQVARQRWSTAPADARQFSVAQVASRPGLARFLVRAKRLHVKADLAQAQDTLDRSILAKLKATKAQPDDDRSVQSVITVQDLMNQFGRDDGQWPNALDVQVHIHRRWKEGQWQARLTDPPEEFSHLSRPGGSWLLPPQAVLFLQADFKPALTALCNKVMTASY